MSSLTEEMKSGWESSDDQSDHSEADEEDYPTLPYTTSSTSAPKPPLPPLSTPPSSSPWTRLFSKPTSSSSTSPAQPLSSSHPIVLPTVKSSTPSLPSNSPIPPHPASSPLTPSPPPLPSSPLPPPSSSSSPSVTHLILDSGAFITGTPLTTYGPTCIYLTPSQVPQELRDEASLHRFHTFPYPIVARQPSSEAIQAVTAFAGLTGDYGGLSVTDLLVLALAWQVEREVNGMKWIRERPPAVNEEAVKALIHNRGQATTLPTSSTPTSPPTSTTTSAPPIADEQWIDETSHHDEEGDEDEEGEGEDDSAAAGAGVEEVEEESSDDGEGRWITPQNLHEQANYSARHRMNLLAHQSSVAIITTDYAMQNVLLQMGLRLISVSGLSISSTRQFLLKCHACFHLTRDMTRQFCPICGLHTLIKCTLVLNTDEEGQVHARMYHGMRHLSKRGTRYSIPRPKGGRGGQGLKFAEDVMEGFGRGAKKDKGGDGLYEGGVEFGMGIAGRVRKAGVVGYGRKNPNVVAKKTGNRKKRH